jgi:glycosyltransferase involved in cell wall biosynthesis
LVVIDNDSDPATKHLVDSLTTLRAVAYVAAPENLGPAGALALGTGQVLRTAGATDWVLFFDDDDPPAAPDAIEKTTTFAERMQVSDPALAGVGIVGARFDIRTGLTVRVPDDELGGPVAVDYVGGGQLPCYLAGAMADVGLPDARLFFGFDDLEYGLRLRAAGYTLYVDGDEWATLRSASGRTGLDHRPSKLVRPVGWRDYYSTRNLVWILRSRGRHVAAARFMAVRIVGKAAYNATRSPRLAWSHLRLGVRAGVDAYLGRMGRTVEPE